MLRTNTRIGGRQDSSSSAIAKKTHTTWRSVPMAKTRAISRFVANEPRCCATATQGPRSLASHARRRPLATVATAPARLCASNLPSLLADSRISQANCPRGSAPFRGHGVGVPPIENKRLICQNGVILRRKCTTRKRTLTPRAPGLDWFPPRSMTPSVNLEHGPFLGPNPSGHNHRRSEARRSHSTAQLAY